MNEQSAIDLSLKLYGRHICPADNVERDESVLVQNIADLYRSGYEVVPAKRELKLGDTVSREDLDRMLREGVIY